MSFCSDKMSIIQVKSGNETVFLHCNIKKGYRLLINDYSNETVFIGFYSILFRDDGCKCVHGLFCKITV